MKTNSKVRKNLEKQYGKGCMFKKANIEEIIKKKRTIKTYKQFKEEQRYTGNIIKMYENQMDLHHLKHKSEGGKTTTENGAIISNLVHKYIHSLPREQEEFINNELRKYKQQIDECTIEYVDDMELPYEIKCKVIQFNEKGKIIEKEREIEKDE